MYKHSTIFFLNSIKTFYQENEKLLMIKRTWFQVLYVKKETTIDTKGSKSKYPHQSFTFRCWWFLIEFQITSDLLNSLYELKYLLDNISNLVEKCIDKSIHLVIWLENIMKIFLLFRITIFSKCNLSFVSFF